MSTEHCLHWDEGDGDCCRCGEPNWCGDDGNTPESLAQFERRRLTCAEHQTRLAAEAEWVCEACGYHNVGGICTHCGRLAAEPKETP